ncbi:hypothetical protein BDF14DRAFT_1811753 [Spinellus fusiger]|nr:hypothetical protein BDF14DRAFT_1811753 [Spinellus fusiger]
MTTVARALTLAVSVRPLVGLRVASFQSHVMRPTTFLGLRAYSTEFNQGKQVLVRDHGVFAHYIPPESSPSITDFKKWRISKWRNMMNNVQNLLSVGLIKYKSQYEKWNSAKFLGIAEETYKDMNDAFARGDRTLLEEVCLDAMYSNLKNQLRQRGAVRWEWKYHGNASPSRIVCVRCMGTSGISRHGFSVGQVTVKMTTQQSMAVYDKKNRLVGGDPQQIHTVVEYIVFQKTISDPEDIWRIYGKIAPAKALTQ